MELSWYYWVTVMSLVTNFHACLCSPTLQPPIRSATSKHELDSDESRKVLGSSVVTSISVIMDHGNGTKTFLTNGIDNPELKSNAVGSPGNLFNPDRYEFYTFDETGDLVKRLMTWDEIQGLIAGGDGDSLLGEASVPMYYSDLPEKASPTHLTANDFQTSDIQGVHKVVESVQNVLKSELAASQSKIPPVAKPGLLSNAPNWSLFLPTLLDNAEDGSELGNLGILASPLAPTSKSPTSTTSHSSNNFVSTTEATKSNLSEVVSTTMKEFIKKTEKPNRYKVTTNKPSVPSKSPFNPPNKASSYSTTERWPTSSLSSSFTKKPYSTFKYGLSTNNDEHWTSTFSTTPKKTFTSFNKYGGYVPNDERPFPTAHPVKKNSTTAYNSNHPIDQNSPTTPSNDFSSTRKTFSTSKYGSQSTSNELFSSIASVLQQVTDEGKPSSLPSLNATKEKLTSTSLYKTSTEAASASTFDKVLSMSQFKNTAEPTKHSSFNPPNENHKYNGFHQRPTMEYSRPTTEYHVTSSEPYKTSATEKIYTDLNKFSTWEYSKLPSLQHKYTQYHYKPTTEQNTKPNTEKNSLVDNPIKNFPPSSENQKLPSSMSNVHRPAPSSFLNHKTPPSLPDAHKTTYTFLNSHKPSFSLPESQKVSFTNIHALISHATNNSSTQSSFRSTTESVKPTFTDSLRIASPHSHTSSSIADPPTSTKKIVSSTPANVFTITTKKLEVANHKPSNITSEKNLPQSHTNPYSFSSSKDILKTTKIYESSTPTSTGYTSSPSLKQTISTKPLKNKINYTKSTPKPESLFSTNFNRLTSLSTSEKTLIRISTLRSTVMDQTTTKAEPLVTWISTSSLEDTPSKVSLFGVYDSDKLVTEQYVSSSNDQRPSISQFFRNTTIASPTTSTTSTTPPSSTTSTESSTVSLLTESYNDIRQSTKQSYKPFPSSTFSRLPSNSNRNTISSFTDVTRPVRPSERPHIESKTESTHHPLAKHPSNGHHTSSDSIEKFKTTTKTSLTSQIFPASNSFSETVMQRIPTINPPNKVTSSSNLKATTKPVFMFTDSMKNITQIAVMLNKSNETATKSSIRNEYRNKVTHPSYETTKPINPVFVNDCITSLISSGALKDNYTTESATNEHSHIHYYKLPPSEEKTNSLIYYYKLPSLSTSQNAAHSSRPIENLPHGLLQYYKPELADGGSTKPTIDKEYQKLTTLGHRPTNDVIQDGISSVANVLLQTESRVPNKEFTEYEPISASRLATTETLMRTDDIELNVRNTTKSKTADSTIMPSTISITASYKLENRTTPIQNFTYLPSTISENTTDPIELTSVSSDTDRPNNRSDYETTTTEMFTTDSINANEPATTIINNAVSDFRNEYLDERTTTPEENEDGKYDQNSSTTAMNIKNNSSRPTTAAYAEITRTKNSTVVSVMTSTFKPAIEKTTSKPLATIEKVDVKTQSNNHRVNGSTNTNITSVEYVEIKLENTTKADANAVKTDLADDSPPPSAFRSPAGSSHKVSTSTVPGVELHPAPHESMGLEASIVYLGDDVKRFVDFCNELSFKIWTTQTGKNLMNSRSIVLSPFAAISTLAMVFLGARGSSSGIMNDFLKLDDMVTFNPHQVLQNITESSSNPKNIGVANSVLVREIFSDKSKGKVLEFYKERLQQYYDTYIEEINFNSIGDLIRKRTNLLVKRQTQGKIQDYLKGSALVMKPPLAILTANIFQTNCEVASTDGRDGEMYFVVRPSARQRRLVPIPAVVYRSGFLAGYEPGLDVTAVTLNPESTVSTILVLPGQQGQVAPGDGLARLEQRLLESSYRRGAWSRLLRSLLFRPGLELQIPRFSHKSVLNLTTGLQKMGMDEIFSPDKADLRGINGLSNELHLSDIVQVNMFSTCGESTVGARHHTETYPSSPQRVGRMNDIFDRAYLDDSVNNYYSSLPLNLRPRQARLPDNPRLRFDRPFLYIVRHNPTGMILYIGRFNPRLLP